VKERQHPAVRPGNVTAGDIMHSCKRHRLVVVSQPIAHVLCSPQFERVYEGVLAGFDEQL
jgi:hypothetical protein